MNLGGQWLQCCCERTSVSLRQLPVWTALCNAIQGVCLLCCPQPRWKHHDSLNPYHNSVALILLLVKPYCSMLHHNAYQGQKACVRPSMPSQITCLCDIQTMPLIVHCCCDALLWYHCVTHAVTRALDFRKPRPMLAEDRPKNAFQQGGLPL